MPMLDISQNPERVSNILRSSIRTIRPSGMRGARARRGRAASVVPVGPVVVPAVATAVMPLLLRVWCLAGWRR